MYFILTDINDMCYYYQYKTLKSIRVNSGLNDINIIGLYLIFKNPFHKQYNYLRVVNAPNNNTSCYNDRNEFVDGVLLGSSVILSDRYYLYDPITIKKFKIKVDKKFVGCACAEGAVKFLEWWKNSCHPLEYDESALTLASSYNQVEVLDWWLKSNLPLKYDETALNIASVYGNINVLDWWLKSKLPLKYSLSVISRVSRDGHISFSSEEWWKNSGLPLKY